MDSFETQPFDIWDPKENSGFSSFDNSIEKHNDYFEDDNLFLSELDFDLEES